MNPTPALLALALPLALAGCASTEPQLEKETAYQVEWIGERPLIDRSHLSITFDQDGRAFGSAGCNHWFASYQLQGNNLSFGPAGSTRKLCAPALMEQEQRFLKALQQIRRWDISPIDQLRLWPEQGKPLRLLPENS
jgi:heat shock protein HslJ